MVFAAVLSCGRRRLQRSVEAGRREIQEADGGAEGRAWVGAGKGLWKSDAAADGVSRAVSGLRGAALYRTCSGVCRNTLRLPGSLCDFGIVYDVAARIRPYLV